MSSNTTIEWTDRSWNPVRGCSVISPGCHNCYAMKQGHRFSSKGKPYEGLTKLTKAGPQWTGKIRLVEDALRKPVSWRKPARIFVNSMSDLFHDGVPDAFIDRVFAVMALAPRHTFQILTKRADRLRAYMSDVRRNGAVQTAIDNMESSDSCPFKGCAPLMKEWPLPNVWLGVSVENQQYADERIPHLLQTPAAVRFISAEPLLGPIDLKNIASARDELMLALAGLTWGIDGRLRRQHPHLDWVIVGGESGGLKARNMDIDWARAIIQQCEQAGVPVFLKQLGRWPLSHRDEGPGWGELYENCHGGAPTGEYGFDSLSGDRKGGRISEFPSDLQKRQWPVPEVRS